MEKGIFNSVNSDLEKFYAVFCKFILDNPGKVKTSFSEFVGTGELNCRGNNDPLVGKLAVISSHREWEEIYREESPEFPTCLGDYAKNLVVMGMQAYGLSDKELRLIREEIVYGNDDYSSALEQLEKAEAEFDTFTPPDGQFAFLKPLSVLERWDDYFERLDLAAREALDDPLRKICSPMELMIAPHDIIPQRMLEQAISDFRATRRLNQISGNFDPVDFDLAFAGAIRELVSRKIEEAPETGREVAKTQIIEELLVIQSSVRRPLILDISPGKAREIDEKTFELMCEHDELLIDCASVIIDDSLDEEVFFHGSKVRCFRERLNLAYPGKAEALDIIAEDGRDLAKRHSPGKKMKERLKERLKAEFPGYSEFDDFDSEDLEID